MSVDNCMLMCSLATAFAQKTDKRIVCRRQRQTLSLSCQEEHCTESVEAICSVFREADAAAQGIFTGELRMTKGRYSRVGSPRASIKTHGSSTTDMSSSFPPSSYSATGLAQCFFESPPSASFKNFLDVCVSPMSHLSFARSCRKRVWSLGHTG
jgi:hypothetical protein